MPCASISRPRVRRDRLVAVTEREAYCADDYEANPYTNDASDHPAQGWHLLVPARLVA
jgi:hypothetical protein